LPRHNIKTGKSHKNILNIVSCMGISFSSGWKLKEDLCEQFSSDDKK
jgi:hypothetical protein